MAKAKASPPRAGSDDGSTGTDEGGEPLAFEASLQRLEQVVDRLEQGDLELETSLAAFEEGVRLARRCASQLEAAEQKIEILMQEGGKWLARPFSGEQTGEVPEAALDLDPDSFDEG